MTELEKLRAVEYAAREFIKRGLRLTVNGLIVIEKQDNSDPHYKLCMALDAIQKINT